MEHDEIVLFDGVCNLCNTFVLFFLRREKKSLVKFASLQSQTGQLLLQKHQLINKKFDSLIYISKEKTYIKSSAILHLAKKMKGVYPVLFVFIIIPAFIRDFFYDWIAKNRYKWFGKMKSCITPSKEIKERFVDI